MKFAPDAPKVLILSCIAVKQHAASAVSIDYGVTWIPTVYGQPMDTSVANRGLAIRMARQVTEGVVEDRRSTRVVRGNRRPQ